MRLWSLHPCYLDARGLVACWREGLLARKVLRGDTKGYRHHPQLDRFKVRPDPIAALDSYLSALWQEASQRGYNFNKEKIGPRFSSTGIAVTRGQLEFELRHLMMKLKERDSAKYKEVMKMKNPLPNPVFRIIEGKVESWERGR
jgi:hypothetical protein